MLAVGNQTVYKAICWFLAFLNPKIAESFSLLFFKGVNAFHVVYKIWKAMKWSESQKFHSSFLVTGVHLD